MQEKLIRFVITDDQSIDSNILAVVKLMDHDDHMVNLSVRVSPDLRDYNVDYAKEVVLEHYHGPDGDWLKDLTKSFIKHHLSEEGL